MFDRQTAKNAIQPPPFLWPVSSSVGRRRQGDLQQSSPDGADVLYSDRHHNQMEPHATTAVWDEDGTLTLYETTQHIFGARELVSMVLGIPQEKIRRYLRISRRWFWRQGVCLASYPDRGTRGESSEQAGPRSAHARADVFHGRPSGGEHAGNQARCGAKWQAERYSPR